MVARRFRFAILGGGAAGLSAAMELAEEGFAVTVYEKSGVFGGLASGFPVKGLTGVFIEKFYHHIFRSDTDLIALIHRLGLQERLEWYPDRSCVFKAEKAWPLEAPWDVLRCDPIGSLAARLRFAYASYKLQSARDWKELDAITCGEFYRCAGAEVGYRNFWAPLLACKFGPRSEEASAAFLWGRIQARRNGRFGQRSGLGYIRGGFQQLFNQMIRRLAGSGNCQFRAGTAVVAIWQNRSGGLSVRTANGVDEYDVVISTIPVTTLADLLLGADANDLAVLRSVDYMAALCMILRLKQPLSEWYWTNVMDPDLSMGVIVEHTNLVPCEDYGGTHVVYVANYLPQNHPWLREKPGTIFGLHSDSLARMYKHWNSGLVVEMHVIRARYATPIYLCGHGSLAARLAAIRPFGRVWLADMTQVYPDDRNVSHCIRLGSQVAQKAMTEVAAMLG